MQVFEEIHIYNISKCQGPFLYYPHYGHFQNFTSKKGTVTFIRVFLSDLWLIIPHCHSPDDQQFFMSCDDIDSVVFSLYLYFNAKNVRRKDTCKYKEGYVCNYPSFWYILFRIRGNGKKWGTCTKVLWLTAFVLILVYICHNGMFQTKFISLQYCTGSMCSIWPQCHAFYKF